MHVLIASDLTARSDNALARAFLLARELHGDVRVLHVVDDQMPLDLRDHWTEWSKRTLSSEVAKLSAETGVPASAHVCVGHPATEIGRWANDGATDLLVFGLSRSGALSDATAGSILKATTVAALLVKEDPVETYRQVVVGADFSMFSRAAIRQAVMLAPRSCMHVVHAFHVPFRGFLGSESFIAEVGLQQRLEFDAFLKEEMEALEKRAYELGLPPGSLQKIIQEGEPVRVLRFVCENVAADLVVIATTGRSDLSRAVWGSVAADLLNNPPCDVLVIRPF